MSNVHGLRDSKESDDEKDDTNNRYVGGIGDRGGGSGLAVEPNNEDAKKAAIPGEEGGGRDAVFGMAQDMSTVGDGEQIRRTITMYRDGFTIDDGPYRRLDDPANAEFLRSLATGRTPRELHDEAGGGDGNVVVGLVDKRSEDYVETFRSFGGAGESLGGSAAAAASTSVFDPAALSDPTPVADGEETTSIAVRLLNGKRKIVKIALTSTVSDLASYLRSETDVPFVLAAGFPPKPLEDGSATIQAAGLQGSQVSMQKA